MHPTHKALSRWRQTALPLHHFWVKPLCALNPRFAVSSSNLSAPLDRAGSLRVFSPPAKSTPEPACENVPKVGGAISAGIQAPPGDPLEAPAPTIEKGRPRHFAFRLPNRFRPRRAANCGKFPAPQPQRFCGPSRSSSEQSLRLTGDLYSSNWGFRPLGEAALRWAKKYFFWD